MPYRSARFALLAPVILLIACEGFMSGEMLNPLSGEAKARSRGYALLHSTVDELSQVDKVLVIKDAEPQVADLLKAIAQFSGDCRDKLQTFAAEDPSLRFNDDGLPNAEASTRNAIASATQKQILFSSGREFEFNILLTQHQALNYITHLAGTLSEQDSHEDRRQYLTHLAGESNALRQRVIALLQSPYISSGK